MKKEVLFAIILGFAIGLIITFGIYTAQKALQQKTALSNQDVPLDSTTQPSTTQPLEVYSPEHESVFSQNTTTVTGMTSPDAHIVILVNQNHFLGQADNQGNFSQDITLESGVNYVKVIALDQQGSQTSLDLTLTYTTYDLESDQSATPSSQTQDD